MKGDLWPTLHKALKVAGVALSVMKELLVFPAWEMAHYLFLQFCQETL